MLGSKSLLISGFLGGNCNDNYKIFMVTYSYSVVYGMHNMRAQTFSLNAFLENTTNANQYTRH